MHHVTRRWQCNQYPLLPSVRPVPSFPSLSSAAIQASQMNQSPTKQIIRCSILLFSLINEFAAWGVLPSGAWALIVLSVVQYVPMFTLGPRFIISIRELHARDVQNGTADVIDTGFGLSSSTCGGCGTEIMFAHVGQNGGPGLEGVEEIPMEVETAWSA